MATYVDDMRASFGRMALCYMIVDTTNELQALADRIAVRRRWLKNPGSWREHFEIFQTKRPAALAGGAVTAWGNRGRKDERADVVHAGRQKNYLRLTVQGAPAHPATTAPPGQKPDPRGTREQ